MIGRPDFYGRQFNRNFCERRGDLFYPMRKKFHYQPETGEGTRQLDWDSAAIRRMNVVLRLPTSSEGRDRAPTISWNSSELCSIRQTKWCPRPLRTCSGAMPVLSQKLLNCFHDRLLNCKDALRIEKHFRRIIEVDVFNIEVRNQCVAIPERTADFKTIVQKRI